MNGYFSGLQAVGKGHLRCFSRFNDYVLRIGTFADIWTSLGDDLLDGVGAGKQVVRQDRAVLPSGKGSHQLVIRGVDLKFPTCHTAPIRHGFDNLGPAIVGVGKGYGCRLVGSDGHRFYRGIALPIGIASCKLLSIQGSRQQTSDGFGSSLPCCEGRAGHRAGAGRIRIKPDLPAAQILPRVGFLHQLHAACIQLVCKTDRCRGTRCHRHRLRVGAGTVVQGIDCAVRMPKLLNIVGSGCQPCDGDFAAGIGGMRSRNQSRTSRIGIDSKLPPGEILTILGCFRQADRPRFQLIYKADSRSTAACYRYLLGIGAGACVESIDAAVRMPQLLDIVSTSQQTRHGDLSAAVRGMGPGYQTGTGAVAVNPKPPAGKVLAILCGLRQADSARIGCTQLEIGIEISAGGRIQLHTGLIGRTGAVVDGKGRVRRRWQIAACREHRGLGNRPGLGNCQAVSALAEAGAVSVGEGEI